MKQSLFLILVLAALNLVVQAQNESSGDIFFASSKNKVALRAFFMADIEGLPTLEQDTFHVTLKLNAAANESDVRKYVWVISGPKNQQIGLQSEDRSTTTRLSVPSKRTGRKNYKISLAILNKNGASSLITARKLKFQVTRSCRKNFGDDLSYEVSSIWLD